MTKWNIKTETNKYQNISSPAALCTSVPSSFSASPSSRCAPCPLLGGTAVRSAERTIVNVKENETQIDRDWEICQEEQAHLIGREDDIKQSQNKKKKVQTKNVKLGPVPSSPRTGTGPLPGGWGPLLNTIQPGCLRA